MLAARLICKHPRGALRFFVYARDVAGNAQAAAARLRDLFLGPKCPDWGRTMDRKVTRLRLVTLVWRAPTDLVLTAALALGACGESEPGAVAEARAPCPGSHPWLRPTVALDSPLDV